MKARSIPASQEIRVGTDLVWIPDIQASIANFGDRYLQQLFCPEELYDCRGEEASRNASLAARFAAKEALMKVLRPSRDTVLNWQNIQVLKRRDGSPELVLLAEAYNLARKAGVQQLTVSLSHEHEYASATVLATCRKPLKNHRSSISLKERDQESLL
ncbi:holo-ACP synthase [Undibacterium sp. TJN19]|uniref:holo-ACP synthase n=1 Tax=Undibacterium sp. TJN19 TaxID=3413055 RepID=UPI003BF230E2